MPTILTHPAVPLALGLALGPKRIPPRLLAAGVVASILPDLDVLAFRLGIPYSNALGHRGISHSLFFALLIALLGTGYARKLNAPPRTVFLFLLVSGASHGLLDMLTDGGLGVALWWPFSDQRYFAPWQPIHASPLSLHRLLTPDGMSVLLSEIEWVWLPALLVAMIIVVTGKLASRLRHG